MENSELQKSQEFVYDMFNKLSHPMLLVNNESEVWEILYSNELMNTLLCKQNRDELDEKIEKGISEPQELCDTPFIPKSLDAVLNEYLQNVKSNSYTMYDVEIFDKIYHIHFSKEDEKTFLIFIELEAKSIFNDIPFHDISNSSSAIIIVLNEDGLLVDVNNSFLELLEMKDKDVLNIDFLEVFVPGDVEKLKSYFREIKVGSVGNQHFITPLKTASGAIHKINWQVSKKIFKNNHTYLIAIGSNIGKLLNQNRKLKQELSSVKVGFNYFPHGVAYMNGSGKFTLMNPRFKKIFAIDKELETLDFDKIPSLKRDIGFDKMSDYIKLIKEMSYVVKQTFKGKELNLKVDVRLLSEEKKSVKLYIVVVQRLH